MTTPITDPDEELSSVALGGENEDTVQGEKKRPKKTHVPSFFSFDIRFWVLVCILSVLYIAMRNYYDKLWREEQALEEEVKNLRSESITLTAELMRSSKESEVAKMVEAQQLDLKESRRPPIRIKYQER